MDLAQLQLTLRQFAAEREWTRFHTPKNLAMALMVEAAELAEIFQWMTPEQSQTAHGDKVVQEQIADEVADVLLYLLQLADHTGIDLKRAVGRKLVKNAKKHLPTQPGLPAGPLALLEAPTHVLVDWENVQPHDQEILALVPDATHVWIFHGKTQKNVDAHQKAFGELLTLVPIARSGKNALDFHLSFYMGYITSRNPDARIVVLSNDQGYGPMLEHAQDLGFSAAQKGFTRAKAPARKQPARKQPARKPAAKKASAARKATAKASPAPAPSPSPLPQPAPAAPPVRKSKAAAPAKKVAAKPAKPVKGDGGGTPRKAAGKTAAKSTARGALAAAQPAPPAVADKPYAHVVKALLKSRDKPTRRARLVSMVRSLLDSDKADDATVDAVIHRLQADGHLRVDDKGAVSVPG